jgi:hypothetical protein
MKTIDLGNYTGKGATKTEALADLHANVKRDCGGTWKPVFYQAGAYSGILWREPGTGWVSALLHHDGSPVVPIGGYSIGNGDFADTDRSMRRHLADLATNWKTCDCVDDVHAICENADDRTEIVRRCRWQRSYHVLKNQGLSDQQAHQQASAA